MMASDNKDTVPGLGFKDKEKALDTIKNLEGRDSDYQKLAVKGLIGRAKRTLQVTKAQDKVSNIKEALDVFEKWLKDFEKLHIPNWSYLPVPTIESFLVLKEQFNLTDEKYTEFLAAYKSAEGDYKKLRTVTSGDDKPTWDIIRNNALRDLMKIVDDECPDLWDEEDDLPTEIHMQLLLWAYSPDASRIKKNLNLFQEKLKKKYGESDENGDVKKTRKRKPSEHSESESESDEEKSPEKKRATD